MKNVQDWIDLHLGKEIFSPGLERIRDHVRPLFLQLKSKGTRFVTIAGTNGKGQTAHTLAHLLKDNKISYTLWTSPHIVSITERMSSEKGDVGEDWLLQHCLKHQELTKSLSYFEFLFYLFMEFSQQLSPQIIILEVGLGGRLDAVNALDSDVMAITSISRDHEEILGNSYAAILKEKWGISRAHKPIFTAFTLNYLRDMTKKWSDHEQVLWKDLVELGVMKDHDHFFTRNQLMALTLFHHLLGIKTDVREDLQKRRFPPMPHRGDEVNFRGGKLQFLGSHNIDGMRKLVHYFSSRKEVCFDDVLLSFSKRPLKDIECMMKSLQEEPKIFPNILVTKFQHPKAWNGDLKTVSFSSLQEVKWEDYLMKEKLEGKNILVTGSYYFVGEVKKFLLLQF
ncbi:MAG: Mur ligase family protein [Bacteriovoracaceae bacterium]